MYVKKTMMASFVALLILSLIAVPPALANEDEPDPPIPAWALAQGKTEYVYGCLHEDYRDNIYGYWPAGTYSTWITPAELELIYQGVYPSWVPFWAIMRGSLGKCPLVSPSTEADFSFGASLDIWYGSCGMYFPEASFTGHASLAPLLVTEGVDALRPACTLALSDVNDLMITKPMGLYYYYHALDLFLYQKWEAGDLGLYVYDDGSDTWAECAAYLIDADPDNGEYGRVVCIANWLGPFVVGEK